tara:strand:+ start:6710 stop:7207 length:498 start_codon:yes stop_codon:yes gene_type:complete
MPRANSAKNTAASQARVITEQFIVDIAFTSPVRLSSRATVTYDANSYEGRDMRGTLKLDGSGGSLQIRDADFALTPQFISEGLAGREVIVRALYGSSPYAGSDADILFHGEMGKWDLSDDTITFALVEPQFLYFPNIYITAANGFNHLPPKGTRFSTPNGIIELQ